MRKLAKLAAVVVWGCSSMSGINAMDKQKIGDLYSVINALNAQISELKGQVSEINKKNQELWKHHIWTMEDNIAQYLSYTEPGNSFFNWLKSVVEGGKTSFSAGDLLINVKPFLDEENQYNPVSFVNVYGGLFKQLSESVSTGIDITPELFSELKRLWDNIKYLGH